MNGEIKFKALFFPENEWTEFTLDEVAQLGTVFINYKHWRRCTDLKDKNGVDVYDGDILRWSPCDYHGSIGNWSPSVVEWKNGSFNLELITCDEYEVIGNIYENPELLEDPSHA